MAIELNGSTGITTPGLINTGAETVVNLTTSGNTILGDASTDTLNVGNGGLVKDASGNVGIGTASPISILNINGGTGDTTATDVLVSLSKTTSTGNVLGAKIVLASAGSTNYGNLIFRVKTTATGSENVAYYTDAMTLFSSSGGVSIGNTTNPGATNLSVTGTINKTSVGVGGGTAVESTQVGITALTFNVTGQKNTAVGYDALRANTGSNCTALGHSAGSTLTSTGGDCLFLGRNTQPNGVSDNTEIVMGVNPSGSVTGKGGNTFFVYANNSGTQAAGGSYFNGANSSSWNTVSDARIKENVTPLTNALQKVLALNPVEFDYITSKIHDVSFLAQEFATVLPDQVTTMSASKDEAILAKTDTLFGLRKNLDPYLVKAIQEQQAMIDELKAKVAALEAA